jgi:hypothetical protein
MIRAPPPPRTVREFNAPLEAVWAAAMHERPHWSRAELEAETGAVELVTDAVVAREDLLLQQ